MNFGKTQRMSFAFFFFLISQNDIYTKVYSMHEEHRANPEKQEVENREKT